MSVHIEFYLSEENVDRLFSVKNSQGDDDLTGNEFARKILERELYKLHPHKVEFDESGREI